MTAGVVHLMRLANLQAQERIAQGRDPAFEALAGDAPEVLVGTGSAAVDASLAKL
jgi:hypothetical protein